MTFYEVGYYNYAGTLKTGIVTDSGLVEFLRFVQFSETLTMAYVSKER